MLRIAVQAKGRLFDETMSFLEESDIKLSATKRTLLVQSSNSVSYTHLRAHET